MIENGTTAFDLRGVKLTSGERLLDEDRKRLARAVSAHFKLYGWTVHSHVQPIFTTSPSRDD